MTKHSLDLLIVGAGPVGLYGAYYAGVRGLRTAVIDSLSEVGGQVSALYPEKLILDVAGFPGSRAASWWRRWPRRRRRRSRCTCWVSRPWS